MVAFHRTGLSNRPHQNSSTRLISNDFRLGLNQRHNARSELDPGAIYIQIVRPGLVNLPEDFKVEILGEYGALKVAMPEAALLSATKLVRNDPRDVEDVAWSIKERALGVDEIRAAVNMLPDASQREVARENMILVELVRASERTRK
jgi:hypothetical protein